MNDMDYEYISINYDYILCRHLIACTEFDYLLTPDNYDRLFSGGAKSILPAEQPVRKVTLVLGIFFDGTGNNAVNTRNMLLRRSPRSILILRVQMPKAFLPEMHRRRWGSAGRSDQLSGVLHEYSLVE